MHHGRFFFLYTACSEHFMDDFFYFAIGIVILVPIAMFVMLLMLMSRQNLYHDDISRKLETLKKSQADDRTLLHEIMAKLTAVPVSDNASIMTEALAAEITHKHDVSSELAPIAPVSSVIAKRLPNNGGNTFSADAEFSEGLPEQSADVTAVPVVDDAANQFVPAEPGRFELAAKQILRGIWNWIIVGDSQRPEGTTMEYAVASNWLLRIGVLILVSGIGFFLKYSIDNGLLGEHARVALTVLTGVGMVVGGVKLVGGRYHLFSQGMLGGGIAVLYFSVFAAFSFYHLIGASLSFALMALVTACAATLAVRLNAMLIAIFAIIGGYCTPILLSTGVVNFVGLFSYMLLLGIGTLSINRYKQWHLLNYLSFFFNYLLFFGSMQSYSADYVWQVLPFLAAFFILYSTMIFLFCLVNQAKSTLLDLVALLVNSAIFFATVYYLVAPLYGAEWVALVAVFLAAFYVAHVYFGLAKQIIDKQLMLSFIGLSALFIAIALPLILSDQWITVSWSIQALVMLWMAGQLRSAFLQQTAYILYLIVLARFALLDLPAQYSGLSDVELPFADFLLGLLVRLLSFGIPIASMALAYFVIGKPVAESAIVCRTENDVRLWLKNTWLLPAVVSVAATMLFVVLQLEFYRSFGYIYPPLQMPMLTLVWLSMCLFIFMRYQAAQQHWLRAALVLFVVGVVSKLVFDLFYWNLSIGQVALDDSMWTIRYAGEYSFEFALMRLLDFVAVIAFLVFAFLRLTICDQQTAKMRQVFAGLAPLLLFVFLSLEVNSMLYHYVPGFRSGGVSILWGVFALSFIIAGIKRDISLMRLVGLGLFALVACKIFFIDLARLEQLYRILAFIVLGMFVLGGAFVYMRYRQTFVRHSNQGEK
jgi:uncharacterized membrane protein